MNSKREEARSQYDAIIEDIKRKLKQWEIAVSATKNTLTLRKQNLESRENAGKTCPTCGQEVLDERHYREGVDEAKREVAVVEEKLASETDSMESVQSTLENYESKRESVLAQWDDYISKIKTELEEKFAEEERQATEVGRQATQTLIQTNARLEAWNTKKAQEEKLRLSLNQRDEFLRELELEIVRHKERISILEENKKKCGEEIQEKGETLSIAQKNLAHWDYWKTNIPNLRAAALNKVLGYLNGRVAEYLDLFSGGVMGMELYQKQHGKNSKVEVDLRTPGGSYGMSSGGERRRVDLAIYLALSDLVHISSGVSCNILVADEIMDGQSPEGVKKFGEILRQKAQSGMCVFIVSHNPVS